MNGKWRHSYLFWCCILRRSGITLQIQKISQCMQSILHFPSLFMPSLYPTVFTDEAMFLCILLYLFVDGSLQLWVACFIKLDAWEEVLNQTQEERLILINLTNTMTKVSITYTQKTENNSSLNPTNGTSCLFKLLFCNTKNQSIGCCTSLKTDQLGEIHVPEDSHDNGGLGITGVGSLGCSQGSQHWQDVP